MFVLIFVRLQHASPTLQHRNYMNAVDQHVAMSFFYTMALFSPLDDLTGLKTSQEWFGAIPKIAL